MNLTVGDFDPRTPDSQKLAEEIQEAVGRGETNIRRPRECPLRQAISDLCIERTGFAIR